MYESIESLKNREQLAQHELLARGWTPLGGFRFLRNGKIYDLSAADLSQLERIEQEGLFVV